MLCYAGTVKYKRIYFGVALLLFIVEFVLLILNFFRPLIFHVDDMGEYQTDRLRRIINEILEMSRIEAGKLKLTSDAMPMFSEMPFISRKC